MLLNTLSISNFKCFDNFEIDFDEKKTRIAGDNGTGKTSICDAYFWLLFGKNSLGQALNPRPKRAEATKTTVTAKITLDSGETVYISRCQQDKGKKTNDTAKAATETTYMINDVPKKKKDYDDYIADICPPDIFNYLSNPLAFASGREKNDWQSRRTILVNAFAGEKSDGSIIDSHEDLSPLRERMNYHSVDDFMAVTEIERKKTNKRLNEIPIEINAHKETIDETKINGVYAPSVVARLSAEKTKIANEISAIRNGGKKEEIAQKIKITKAEIELAEVRFNKDNGNSDEISKIKFKIADLEIRSAQAENSRKAYEVSAKMLKSSAETYFAIYNKYASEKPSSEPICPTCHQALPERLIAERQSMFNEQKAERLKSTRDDYMKTLDEYKRKREKIKALQVEEERFRNEIDKLNDDLKSLISGSTEADFKKSDEYIRLSEKLKSLEAEYNKLSAESDAVLNEKENRITELQQSIDEMNAVKAATELIEREERKIKELQAEQQRLGKLSANWEENIELIQKFMQYKITDIEEQINSHFSLVRWKLFEVQVNGIIKDCCEATVDGVGFNDGLNSAARINAGIDIINALSYVLKNKVPVWIDNAEGITKILKTEGQQICMYVDESQPKIKILN